MVLRTRWYREIARLARVSVRVTTYLGGLSPNALVILLAAIVGICSGFTAVCFTLMLEFSHDLFSARMNGHYVPTHVGIGFFLLCRLSAD